MDTILLLSPEEQKLEKFLQKMGYEVFLPNTQLPLKEVVTRRVLDLIVIDTAFDTDAVELCDFLRNNEATKQVPIICLNNDKVKAYKIKELALEKIEMVPAPCSVGSLVAKIATQLRLRKMSGEDSISATLAETNASLRDLNARFRKEREQARAIQESLLPEKLPQSDRFSLAVAYKPLEEVGGDWYFVKHEGDYISLQIADVTGHGLAAAFVGSMTRLALTAAGKTPPEELLKETNRLISPHLPQGNFITICSLLYNTLDGSVQFASGGHPPGIILNRRRNETKLLKSGGFALGFFEDSEYAKACDSLEKDDVLLIYTDGLTEAQNRDGVQYGTERICQALQRIPQDLNADSIKDFVLRDFNQFCDGRRLKDDITLVVLTRDA